MSISTVHNSVDSRVELEHGAVEHLRCPIDKAFVCRLGAPDHSIHDTFTDMASRNKYEIP